MALLAALAVLALVACGSDAPLPPGTTAKQQGWARVAVPQGWVTLTGADVPRGWDWASQSRPGPAATAQIAVDGDFSRQRDIEISAAGLLAGAQVGGLPGFSLLGSESVDVHGATVAKRYRYTYKVAGVAYEGVWWVAQAEDDRTIAVQLSGRAPLSDALTDQTLAGISISPDDESGPDA